VSQSAAYHRFRHTRAMEILIAGGSVKYAAEPATPSKYSG
jgi:hypothetical protein